MLESTYLATFSSELEIAEGGRVYKIADKATLGLPDSFHVRNSIITYFEAKIASEYELIDGNYFVKPWKRIREDLRQFEVCRSMSRFALVVYCIYWPDIRMSAILTIDQISQLRTALNEDLKCLHPMWLEPGHGVKRIRQLMDKNREEIYGKLEHEYGANA